MIYLDTCLVIYALEDATDRGDRTRALLSTDDTFTVSSMVIMECLVGPLRRGDHRLKQQYERFFDECERVPVGEPVFRSAAELSARHRLKVPDSLHLAAALGGGCSELWTNDHRLSSVMGGFCRNVLQ